MHDERLQQRAGGIILPLGQCLDAQLKYSLVSHTKPPSFQHHGKVASGNRRELFFSGIDLSESSHRACLISLRSGICSERT